MNGLCMGLAQGKGGKESLKRIVLYDCCISLIYTCRILTLIHSMIWVVRNSSHSKMVTHMGKHCMN